jgi:hypothetical protein
LSFLIINSGIFIKSHPLCPFYGEMCKKKSESVTHIWVTEGGENLLLSSNSQSVAISTTSVGQFVLQHPAPPTRLWKMVLPDVLCCHFIHRHARNILKTYSLVLWIQNYFSWIQIRIRIWL